MRMKKWKLKIIVHCRSKFFATRNTCSARPKGIEIDGHVLGTSRIDGRVQVDSIEKSWTAMKETLFVSFRA